MYEELRSIFGRKPTKERTREEKEKRVNAIAALLNAGEYSGFLSNWRVILADWQEHRNWGAWPYPGSRRDQPYAVLHDFHRLDLIEEYFELKAELVTQTSAPPFQAG